MADNIKSPVAILIVLILVSLSFAGTCFYLLQKEKAKSFSLQQQVDDLTIKQRIAQTKLQEYQKTISELELKLKTAQTEIDTLSDNLKQEIAAKQKAQDQTERLKIELEQQKELRSDLETKLNYTQKKVEETETQLKKLDAKKVELEEKIKDLGAQVQQAQAKGVELGTIVIGQEGSTSSDAVMVSPTEQVKRLLEGEVLVVNKEYNFIVINLGSKDGLKVNDIFSLYDNKKYIGDVRIEKVHESMSAADFMSPSIIKNKVSEGNRVVQKAP